ncbi:hypothetical protein A2707_01145 [Candidatus Saccharibacteria bacterium RIFCSPHIGHO2_01_FULL_45_15]|nr:MAG: hypothetical protein A2707_01145 [Candidatus Saccharibacteria bacterium RIFCSPHIGHO2_01_FULL_45_15]OGL26976.1 MAG: hypothetical protein A3C39_02260 [Candidatus Saccharibacteria bacterium RIFCSPHIGHO2_02_FULL_46_12]OGL32921.1 MAG: hypothetical protein A3E76_06180 [Candidatus Saccharibacteria bacterium RIFCSPHIGHO2_12_FULL_44_22]
MKHIGVAGITMTDDENYPDERWLSNGYVCIPSIASISIRDSSENVTGDSVRRALDPYEEKLASIASSLAYEARHSSDDQ